MLVFNLRSDRFTDHGDTELVYRLPNDLVPLTAGDGMPQVFIMRGPDSGLLSLRLATSWPPLALNERRVPIVGARFRLLLSAPAGTQTGEWREASFVGEAIVDRSVSLDPMELAIARHLGRHGGDVVDVEVELFVEGLTQVFPWIARGDFPAIRARLAALIGDTPATWDEVEDAFLGLSTDDFIWYPLEPGALPPPTDDALIAIAYHAAPSLLEKTDNGWNLADAGSPKLDINLNVPRTQTRAFGLRWSFSKFLAQQTDPLRHLIEMNVPAPFEAADVLIVNDLPLASEGIKSITVDVMTGGPSGRIHHEFRPGESAAARLRFVRETFEELELRWRARAIVMTSQGPRNVETVFHRSGQMIELNAQNLQLQPLLVSALAEVFDYVTAVAVTVGRRTLELTSTHREAWVVGRQTPTTATVEVTLDTDEKISLGALPLGQQGLTFGLKELGVGEMIDVVLVAPPDIDVRAAYLAIQVENGPWRTLESGIELVWPVRRETRLLQPRLRYRTRHVARDVEGQTQPIRESNWLEGVGKLVQVEV